MIDFAFVVLYLSGHNGVVKLLKEHLEEHGDFHLGQLSPRAHVTSVSPHGRARLFVSDICGIF